VRCIWLVLLVACHRPERPVPKQGVNIQRLPPVIDERFTYSSSGEIALMLTDGTKTVDLVEKTLMTATETVTAVQNGVATQREIRFHDFRYQPLGGEPLDAKLVADKTYRWDGQAATRVDANEPVSEAELAAIKAYVRRDTGEPDLATWLLTDRDFVAGEPWKIPPEEPAPFAHGKHAGTSITFVALSNDEGRPTAAFDISQILVLEPAGQRVPITLNGRIVVDIGRARITSIDVEGDIRERTGPVEAAHMQTHQQFDYPR
jgi:hypothetical protein